MEEYRDIHRKSKDLENYTNIINNSSMSKRQKENINKFILELRLGKAGKKVKNRRIASYLMFIVKLHNYFNKDLDKITEAEATQFYQDLQDNKIKRQSGVPYAQATKDMYVRSLKRYLGWAYGSNTSKKYKKNVGWMKEDYKKSDKKAIEFEDCERVVEKEKSIRNKALFMFLFDSGARIEEALNVRIKDLTRSSKNKFYMVQLRGTKTETSERKISLPLITKQLTSWLKEHPTGEDEDYLFPLNYDHARKIIRTMSKAALDYAITPHELRHSSATYYIQRFGADNIGGFYYRLGWKFGSKTAQGYIKQHLFGGEVGQEKVVKTVESDRMEKLEEKVRELKEALDLNNKVMREQINQMVEQALKNK